MPRPKRPRVLVLGPTKELTEQITAVAKRLCHTAKFRAACVNANKRWVAERRRGAAGTRPGAGEEQVRQVVLGGRPAVRWGFQCVYSKARPVATVAGR